MTDAVRDYDALVAQMDRLQAPAAGKAVTTSADLCGIWKVAKPVVETGIKILRLLPFSWAKKLADVLETLAAALNALCP